MDEKEPSLLTPLDVTDQVSFGNNDDEHLPLEKCVCGKQFGSWDAILSIYPAWPWECDGCGAKLYFRNSIVVFKVAK